MTESEHKFLDTRDQLPPSKHPFEKFQDAIEEIAKTDPNFQDGFSKKDLAPTDWDLYEEFLISPWKEDFSVRVTARASDHDGSLNESQKQFMAYLSARVFDEYTRP